MVLPSEGNLFIAKPEPLADLLKDIHDHKIALPDLQRPWVWEPQMIYDLIISVAYRYPAGSLLTMPIKTTGFALRPFQGSGERLKVAPGLMVLDGQQRLTSLYQALYRQDGVRMQKRTYFFYLDVPELLSDPDGSIDVGDPYFDRALFYVALEKNQRQVRYDGLSPRYELTTDDQRLAVGALPLGYVFDAERLSKWRQDYLVRRSNNDMTTFLALQNHWDQLVQPWLNRIRSYPFPVVELRADMPLSAICHIFEKVNSTGVPLDVFDLCTAILWADGFQLNNRWKQTREQLAPLLPMQPLSGTYFLQGIALLDSLDRKRTSTGQVAVACRKQDLMNLRRSTVEQWWPTLIEGYREAAKFMASNGILAERVLPYSTLIVPLSAIFADLKRRHGAANIGAAWAKIGRWYWCNVFSQRYSSQVETTAALDVEQVIHWIENDGPQPTVVQTFSFRADALQEITSIRNAIYKGVLCLLARGGARDFGGGGTLNIALMYDTRQDHHHIFPTNALKTLGIDDPRADTIVNKTPISASVNQSIGGHLPANYVTNWRGKLGDGAFDQILHTHAINPAPLSRNDWQAFLHDRREQLRALIQETCGGRIQPFSDTLDDLIIDDDTLAP